MAFYLKKFENHTQYNNYINGSGAILPNVSICATEGDVHYNPSTPVPPTPTETRLVAKYYVESEGSPITLFYSEGGSGSGSGSGSGGEPPFSAMEIDGVESEVVNEYTFDTAGEHTVKFTLADPTSIGAYAFHNCSSLTSIVIPSGVTSISNGAFDSCGSLTSIVIPSGVTSIGYYVFSNCSGLTSMTVDGNNTVYDSRGNCNAIIETSTNALIQGCKTTIIPNSVTSIGDGAFYDCSDLTNIVIPSGVTSIGGSAFYQCSSLTSCTIGSGVTSIGYEAFGGCSGLTNIVIPNSVTSIDNQAFLNCGRLTSCTIGNGVTSIGEGAFYWCSSLISIVSNATTAPTIRSNTFQNIKTGGTLTVPIGSSGYDVWMGTGDYYLGKYNWTKVEQ